MSDPFGRPRVRKVTVEIEGYDVEMRGTPKVFRAAGTPVTVPGGQRSISTSDLFMLSPTPARRSRRGRLDDPQEGPLMSDVMCQPGCGACCDPVTLNGPLAEMIERTDLGVSGWPDPATEGGWAVWRSRGWTPFDRDKAIGFYANQRTGDFAREHWTQLPGPMPERWAHSVRVRCDAFDPRTRLCTAHDARPPICSEYPRYGRPAGDPEIAYGEGMAPACTYNADVRTMLPIVEVRTRR